MPKSKAAFTSNRQGPQIKKTFAVLAKVSLATFLSLPAQPGIAPVLTAVL
jgi:hypothetical protein